MGRIGDKMLAFSIIQNEQDRVKTIKLYNKYKNLMFKEAYAILKRTEDAEDAVSESFIRIINNLHKIDEFDHLTTAGFLVIICRNVAKSMVNKEIKKQEFEEPLDENTYIPEDPFFPENFVISLETSEMLSKIIYSLDEIYSDVFILKHFNGYSLDEISELLGLKKETVKKRLQRAKEMIIKQLKEKGGK